MFANFQFQLISPNRREDDGEVVRELPATGPNVKKPQPLVKYKVNVHTGDKFGGSTDANVFCCLYGEQGDTGNRPLSNSKNHINKFERKQVSLNFFN